MLSSSPPLRALAIYVPLTLALVGCDTEETESTTSCVVALESVEPSAATAGETATLTGQPFTTVYDSAVYVGSERATVMDLDRTGCEACDECRDDEPCSACGDCDTCDTICTECVETLTFTVPQAASGPTTVQLFNAYGSTSSLAFEVLPTDTGGDSFDTGENDTGDAPGKKPSP